MLKQKHRHGATDTAPCFVLFHGFFSPQVSVLFQLMLLVFLEVLNERAGTVALDERSAAVEDPSPSLIGLVHLHGAVIVMIGTEGAPDAVDPYLHSRIANLLEACLDVGIHSLGLRLDSCTFIKENFTTKELSEKTFVYLHRRIGQR